ncbi:sugar kinase [Pseudonocardia sp. TRM90224]|uniref:sugar kinase n=1 Tax=Pseudonocardia sp. TRM90224 TaxID=2812678 RepID=UPI001E48AB67|nr:sugar kinase [Pseudonocardia sp. TRM90224]
MPAAVVCLGEALALLPALSDGPPDPATALIASALPAGAELNVAMGLAAADVDVAWVGRVGDDPLGTFLVGQLRDHGVDTGGIEVDPEHPTGCYAKASDVDADGQPATRMLYRRAGSAASAMGPAFLDVPAVRERMASARVVHTSGITAAISATSAAMMRELLIARRVEGPLTSFDINWREQMWPDGDPAVVVELAGAADIVLVGADEARRVFGADSPAALRSLLPGPRLVVVKDGAREAYAVDRAGDVVVQPALAVDVVEPVGAGDAFAAGLLTGVLRDEPVQRCLRRGHLGAAAVLMIEGDSAPPLAAALLDVSEREWAEMHVRNADEPVAR